MLASACVDAQHIDNNQAKADTLHLSKVSSWKNLPQPVNWVNDFDNLYSDVEENMLNDTIEKFRRITSIQIAVVTLDSTYSSSDSFDAYVLHIANTWGVGEKDKNNGILIGISSGYRRIRISTGLGIEPLMSDEKTKQIIENHFTPYFRKADYYTGTFKGIIAIMKHLESK